MVNRYLAQEKRVFDISKFTVVGSPSITSDGVASGFSTDNKLGFPVVVSSPFTLKYKFNTDNLDTSDTAKFGLQFYNGLGSIYFNKGNYTLTVSYPANDGTFKYHSLLSRNPDTDYELTYSIDGSSTFILVKDLTNNTEQTFNLPLYAENVNCTGFSVENFDCGHFYINTLKVEQNGKLIYTPTKPVHLLERRKPKVWNKGQFTIVGNPSVSEDGVASGFSGSDYIKVPYQALGQNFKIFTPRFNSSDVSQTQKLVRYSDGNIRIEIYQNKIRLFRYSDLNVYDLPTGKTTLQNNTDYYYYVEQTTDGTNYYLKGYISTDNKNWTLDIDKTYTVPMYDRLNSAPIQISGVDANQPFIGTLDLKSFKIYTDNTLIFDGGKQTYAYDPSKFTVVGSPTVTEYGVASGFSSGNYIKYPYQSLGDNFEIIFPAFKVNDVTVNNSFLFCTSSHGLRVRLYNSKIRTLYFVGNDSYPVLAGTTTLQNNIEYLYKVVRSFDGTNYTVTAFLSSDNGTTWVQQSQITTDKPLFNNVEIGYLGGNPNMGTQVFAGSINLPSFSITVDGKEVFTGAKESYYVLRS